MIRGGRRRRVSLLGGRTVDKRGEVRGTCVMEIAAEYRWGRKEWCKR